MGTWKGMENVIIFIIIIIIIIVIIIIQAKGTWKQDPEANIWAQEGWEWGVEKAPQWGTS